jgi:hypothetical protein
MDWESNKEKDRRIDNYILGFFFVAGSLALWSPEANTILLYLILCKLLWS